VIVPRDAATQSAIFHRHLGHPALVQLPHGRSRQFLFKTRSCPQRNAGLWRSSNPKRKACKAICLHRRKRNSPKPKRCGRQPRTFSFGHSTARSRRTCISTKTLCRSRYCAGARSTALKTPGTVRPHELGTLRRRYSTRPAACPGARRICPNFTLQKARLGNRAGLFCICLPRLGRVASLGRRILPWPSERRARRRLRRRSR
jgi:hypothetical protein